MSPPQTPTGNPAPDGAAMPLIELRHVSKSYATASGGHITVLDDISLEVRDGEMLALLGQSGSGKSTILRLMAGLTDPSQGAVLSHGDQLEGVNRSLAIVFQSFALYPWLTVADNVQVGLIQRRLDARREREEIAAALELIGLSGYENAYPKQLSGGMRQRVGIARAIVAQPEILCMDEAFSALDVLTAENLRREVVSLWRDSPHDALRSIFFVTHSIDEAVTMASRIVIISSNPGRIRHVIENTLPYPRDPQSDAFAAMVAQVHDAITSLVLPDEPAGAAATRPAQQPTAPAAGKPSAAAPAAASSTRVESIPNVPVESILGLLEILSESDEVINIFDLGERIGKEFGDTIAIVKAAEMLDLVDTPKNEVMMTQVGWYFLAAPLPARKTLFRQAIMKLRLFQIICARLEESPNRRVPAAEVLEELATLLPYDQPGKLLETIVTWARYAGIFDFHQKTNMIVPQEEDEPSDDADEPAGADGAG
ncbi:MAG TPA: nitrate/sulfonate/bicarbonate ABC transporter ATP-binding protein [Burkholderiaceae bacterium]|nr:nitrate/sulfonate/bicarbonate ABC transporter ATP-binding protein [Burkholderiaceae bacterium]